MTSNIKNKYTNNDQLITIVGGVFVEGEIQQNTNATTLETEVITL